MLFFKQTKHHRFRKHNQGEVRRLSINYGKFDLNGTTRTATRRPGREELEGFLMQNIQ